MHFPAVLSHVLPLVGVAAAQLVKVDTRSLDKIYQAAQKETGPLNVIFGGSSQAAATPLVTAFGQAFPKIQLNVSVQLSKYADMRIDRSYIADAPYVDFVMLETVNDFLRWERKNLLLNYKPPNFDDLNPAIKDISGAYLAVGYLSFGNFYYNTSHIPSSRIPTTYADMLDPFWKGKLVLTYPNDDDAVLYLFRSIILQYGFDWLTSLLAQDVLWVRGSTVPSDTVNNGTRALTFTTSKFPPANSTTIKTHPPAVPDKSMSWPQLAAIFRSTRKPESAKLLEAFMLSDAWQVPLAKTQPSVRSSLALAQGGAVQSPLTANNTDITGYMVFEADRENVEWWRGQMEEMIGLVTGPRPGV